MIIAKPVLKNEFWILQKDQQKIGNIKSQGKEYSITIGNQKFTVKNIKTIQKNDVVFEKINFKKPRPIDQVYGFDTGCFAYNVLWDLKRKLPLFTKQRKSRCWFAAGWYKIKFRDQWSVIQNPKLISINRYPYHGPYYTCHDAEQAEIK
jgi:hypothetical protein